MKKQYQVLADIYFDDGSVEETNVIAIFNDKEKAQFCASQLNFNEGTNAQYYVKSILEDTSSDTELFAQALEWLRVCADEYGWEYEFLDKGYDGKGMLTKFQQTYKAIRRKDGMKQALIDVQFNRLLERFINDGWKEGVETATDMMACFARQLTASDCATLVDVLSSRIEVELIKNDTYKIAAVKLNGRKYRYVRDSVQPFYRLLQSIYKANVGNILELKVGILKKREVVKPKNIKYYTVAKFTISKLYKEVIYPSSDQVINLDL